LLVTSESPKDLRKHIEFFARCFKRELHFDFIQFDASESPKSNYYTPYEAHLFHRHAMDLVRHVDEQAKHRAIGACCFRRDRMASPGNEWSLQWVWFHPYFRHQGHLSMAWASFRERYGDFAVDPPLSLAMKAFLAKQERLELIEASK
jgi:hypothetical protein